MAGIDPATLCGCNHEIMTYWAQLTVGVNDVPLPLAQTFPLSSKTDHAQSKANVGLKAQMVAIMCGGEEAIGEACTSWPEILTAHLCHTYPDLPLPSSLTVLLDKCLQAKGASDNPSLQTLQDPLSLRLVCRFVAL